MSTLAVVLAALTQACSDAASTKGTSPTAESSGPSQIASAAAATVATNECATPASSWIFCDDFESNRLTKYFEYDNSGGKFVRASGAGMGGSVGMRATYTKGQASAGRLSLAFGKTPDPYIKAVDAGVANYREIYWRFFVQRKTGWVGNGPGGLTRAMIFASSNWSQAMIASSWSDDADSRYLQLAPMSGTDASGNLVTTRFNDAANMRSLGTARSAATEQDLAHVGLWACYEFHIKLNDAGQSNGVFELSVDGLPSARLAGMNSVGAFNAYGINSLNLEQYAAAGAAAANVRTLDNFVVSTAPVGCGTTTAPGPVASITVALDSTSLTVPHQGQVTATMRDANGTVVAGTPTWSSSNTSAATVSAAGVVSAVSAGTANIIATSGSVTGQAAITINAAPPIPVAVVSVSLAASSLAPGATTQATATTMDANGNTLTGRTITWSSSNTAVATVSTSGLVTAVAAGSANIIATSEGKTGQATLTVVAPPVPVATVSVSLAASSLAPGATTQATATTRDANNTVLTGRVVTWSSSNTAVATVSTTGLVTAVAAGSANIIATSEGKTGQATLTVIAPVASVSVSLAASSLAPGATTQATATTRDANNTVLTGRVVTWSSSNTAAATVSTNGLVTAVAAGSANIVATSEGKTGQAALSVVAPPAPVATVTVALGTSSLAPNATTQATATTRDANNTILTGRVVTWSSSNTAIATVSSTGLVTAKAAGSANIIATSEGKTGQALLTVTGGSTPPTVLFEERFEDTNFASRGWYDLYPNGLTSLSTDHAPGSTHSLQANFTQGQTNPSPSTAGRHLFTPSTSVYLRYWVKYSTNWVGSGLNYHPHEFHFLTNEDSDYSGLASNFLTMYIEQNYQSNGGTSVLSSQDSRNIDGTRINQDLTNVTENRAVSGCNGNPDGTVGTCYLSDGLNYNGRSWRSAQPVFLPTAGAGYKADWHQIEVYFQLNSIVNGKALRDGVAQYWFDGQLVIDRRDVFLRTGAHPNMKFNQFIMAAYIGDGSPINQTLWYDELIVETKRPGTP